jgi:hypothetical protein
MRQQRENEINVRRSRRKGRKGTRNGDRTNKLKEWERNLGERREEANV